MKNNTINIYDALDHMILAPRLTLMLQAFAEANTVTTGSADSTGTGSNISPEVRTFYHRAFLENAKAQLVHEQFGVPYLIPKKHGQTINMRRMEHLPEVSSPLTEGVTPDGGIIRISEVTCGFEQFGYWVGISDVVDTTAPDPILTELMQELGYQGANKRDKYIRNKLLGTTNKMYAPKSGGSAVVDKASIDATCKMTVKLLRSAATKMKANNIAPLDDGLYIWIAHPYVVEDLKNDPEFKDWHAYTDAGVQRMYKGEVGYIEKIRCVETTNALIERVGSSTTHACMHNFIIGKNGYGYTGVEGVGLRTVIKPFGSGDDPLDQRMTAGWKTLVGAKVLNSEAVLDLMTGCAANDSVAAN